MLKALAYLTLLFLMGCHQPSPSTPVALQSQLTDGRLQNQLQRQLTRHGIRINPHARQRIVLIDEKLELSEALSGSDNLVKNSWVKLTVHVQFKRKRKIVKRTFSEHRLLRKNYNQNLAAQHELNWLRKRMQTAIAERIIHQYSYTQ